MPSSPPAGIIAAFALVRIFISAWRKKRSSAWIIGSSPSSWGTKEIPAAENSSWKVAKRFLISSFTSTGANSHWSGRTAKRKSTTILFNRSISSSTTSRCFCAFALISKLHALKFFRSSWTWILMAASGFFISCATAAARLVRLARFSSRRLLISSRFRCVISSTVIIVPRTLFSFTSGSTESSM